MREIEFRAWDQVKKKMVRCSIHQDGLAIQAGYNIMTAPTPARFMVPMQYTGLKDANGVKIFEGDILECKSKAYHQVIFESYFACFNTVHLETGDVDDITRDQMSECFKVIGNIYENPEKLHAMAGAE